MLRAILFTLFCIFGTKAFAGLFDETYRWLDRKSEGWFWYQTDPEPDDEREAPLEKPTELQTAQIESKSEPLPDKNSGPAPLSSAWIRENIQSYLDTASDNPTPENVAAFLYIQRLAMDKSFAFMDATQDVITGNPDLDEINRRPLATYANRKLDELATKNNNSLLNTISQSSGLFVFVDDSEASAAQLDIINMLERSYSFSTIKISSSQASAPLPGTRPDRGHSDQMGIKNYPAVALVRSDGVFDVISQGPVSLPDLNKRILIGAKRLELIDETEFNSTRPINIMRTTPNEVPISAETKSKNVPPIPPAEIVKAFNGSNI